MHTKGGPRLTQHESSEFSASFSVFTFFSLIQIDPQYLQETANRPIKLLRGAIQTLKMPHNTLEMFGESQTCAITSNPITQFFLCLLQVLRGNTKIGRAPCHHVTMSPCHHVTMAPCHSFGTLFQKPLCFLFEVTINFFST